MGLLKWRDTRGNNKRCIFETMQNKWYLSDKVILQAMGSIYILWFILEQYCIFISESNSRNTVYFKTNLIHQSFFLNVKKKECYSYNAIPINILNILITFELANHDQFEHKPACSWVQEISASSILNAITNYIRSILFLLNHICWFCDTWR